VNLTGGLVAIAEMYDGGSRSEEARIGGVGLQTIRDWVLRFNARGSDGLVGRKTPGPRSKLSDDYRRALAAMVQTGPIPPIHSVVRWRLVDLARWIFEEYRIWSIFLSLEIISFKVFLAGHILVPLNVFDIHHHPYIYI
jgi:transposase